LTQDLYIRLYQPGDERDIVNLLIDVFNGWTQFDLACTPLEHWKWKYLDNPFKRNWIVIVKAQGRVVGCAHAIPITIKVGDKEYYSSHGYDLAVHPDYRGRRLSSRTQEMRNEAREKNGVEFAPFETGSPIVRKSYERRYPRFPHKISQYIRILDLDLHFENRPTNNQWFKKVGIRLFRKINAIKRLRETKLSSNINITCISHFTKEIDNFWEENKHQYKYAVKKDHEYLNWRYCDPRGGEYVVYVAMEASEILGYIVLRINRYDPNYPIGCIVDLQTTINSPEVAEMLTDEATRYFDNNDVNYTYAHVVDGHPYTQTLQKLGFVNSRHHLVPFYTLYTAAQEEFQKVSESPSSEIWYCDGDRDSV